MQGPLTTTAPPAHPPESIRRGNVSGPSSLPKFLSHKKNKSANSSTRLLTAEPPSRISSPSPSLGRSEFTTSSVLAQKPVVPASIVNVELAVPPQAAQKRTQTGPQLHLLTSDLPSQPSSDSTRLAPSPWAKRSRVSRDLSLISESPTTPAISPSDAPFLEVTLHSPRASVTGDGIGSLISMYLSRNSSTFVELPPFPAAAVQHDSSVDLPVIVPDEGAGFPLKAAVSIGAVGGRHLHRPTTHPELPLISPGYSTDQSQYSDSEVDSPPPPPPPLPPQARTALQATQPLRVNRTTSVSVNAPSRASRDRDPAEKVVNVAQRQRNRSIRALPKPPDWSGPSRTSSVRSHTTSQTSVWSHSRTGSSSSYS